MKATKQMTLIALAFAVLTINVHAATIDQWKLTEVKTNGYTYEEGPFIGSYAYLNLYEPFFEANPQEYITWGYTACPDPCQVIPARLTNPPIVVSVPVTPGDPALPGDPGTGGSGGVGGSGGTPASGVPEPGTWATVTGGVLVVLSRVRKQRS